MIVRCGCPLSLCVWLDGWMVQREGATAIVKLRFEQALTMNRMVFGMHVSVLVYGTAVVTRPRQGVYQSSTR